MKLPSCTQSIIFKDFRLKFCLRGVNSMNHCLRNVSFCADHLWSAVAETLGGKFLLPFYDFIFL